MTDQHAKLNRLLEQASVSKIVYSLVMPETESVIDNVLDGNQAADRQGRELFHDMFREAWTQKQDALHESFFSTWRRWSSEVVQLDASQFGYTYPTSGASEAIRESIHAYGAEARRDNFIPKLHIFEGEYEGFAAYAAAAGIDVQPHRRCTWHDVMDSLRPNDRFYLSQPSAIDGLIWEDFDAFVQAMIAEAPGAKLMLDLTYVGCVAREFTVNVNYPNIPVVFFSLSKPAGVYYHRVGGMFARQEYPGLFGNKWFKNLTSLAIGTQFMRSHAVHELPRKYRSIQEQVVEDTNRELGLSLEPADVVLLAIGEPSEPPSDLETYLLRGSGSESRVRVCLTPRMAHVIDPSLTPSVSARYYEELDP